MNATIRSVAASLLCAAGLLVEPACADERYLLWSVDGAHNTIYLFGSVHLLGSEEIVWPDTIEAAYEDAESLVFEIDLDDLDPVEMQQTMLQLGVLPAGTSLRTVLGEETYAAMAQHARELGLDPVFFDRYRPWVAALTIIQAQLAALGLSSDAGVEERFLRRARADAKEVLGLETPAEGLGALASMPIERQREFMAYTLAEADTVAHEIEGILRAWRQGDTDALGELLEHGFDEFPDLYGPLTIARNRRWVDALEDLLDDTDDYLVIVGALHLVGEESVLELLEGRGRRVQRH